MKYNGNRPRILIVGGGPVGALNSIYFGRTGKFEVLLCEKRSDIRLDKQQVGRSISLTLSCRGRSALQSVGLEEETLKLAIPIFGRMIHHKSGVLKRIFYGKPDECLFAINRKVLNELLLTEAEKNENVKIQFNTKLIGVDFSKRVAKFLSKNGIENVEFDLLVGNDGAYSTVRQFMSKNMNLDFSQEYIPHGYKEIYFPPKENNSYAMEKNYLHIWPRNDYMLLGLPNTDGSFTGTLFMPFNMFELLRSSDDLFKFFEINFPDALQIIGKSNLEELIFSCNPLSMVTIRCNSYNYGDVCVIMGDAAHAMVPFYGQGVNTGFEDLLIFHEILKNNNFELKNTCSEFTVKRNQDAKAICVLAFVNYVELRRNVTTKLFLLRKLLDNLMNSLFPSSWIPLYSMVCFTRIRYTKCIEERKKQDKILLTLGSLIMILVIVGLIIGTRSFIL